MPGRRIVISAWKKSRTVGVTKETQAQGFFTGASRRRSNHAGRDDRIWICAHEFEGDEALQKSSSPVGVKVSWRQKVQGAPKKKMDSQEK